MTNLDLDTIRVRHAASKAILGAGNKQDRDDIEYLLDLADKQQATLDAAGRLARAWERTATEMIGLTGTTATMICVAELRGVLSDGDD